MYDIALNPSGGGNDVGVSGNNLVEKNYTLNLCNKIKEILSTYDISTYLLRSDDETISYDDRINKLKQNVDKNSLLISITLSTNDYFEIIYSINKDDSLAYKFYQELSEYTDTRYYQMKYSVDTTKDYYSIIRNTPEYNTIILRLGNPKIDDISKILLNNEDAIASSIANVIISYLGKKNITTTNYYIVKKGDTLYSIAKKYNMSVEKLKDINNLKSNLLSINQKLLVSNGSTYIVKKGDTLYSIAKNNNITVDEIKKKNNLNNNVIQIGSVLNL